MPSHSTTAESFTPLAICSSDHDLFCLATACAPPFCQDAAHRQTFLAPWLAFRSLPAFSVPCLLLLHSSSHLIPMPCPVRPKHLFILASKHNSTSSLQIRLVMLNI